MSYCDNSRKIPITLKILLNFRFFLKSVPYRRLHNNFSYYEIANHHLTKIPTCFNSILAIFREFCLKLNKCITEKKVQQCILIHNLSITTSVWLAVYKSGIENTMLTREGFLRKNIVAV